MTFGSSSFGESAFGDVTSSASIDLSATIEWTKTELYFISEILWETQAVLLYIPTKWTLTDSVSISASIEWTDTPVDLAVQIKWSVYASVALSAGIEWQVVSADWPYQSARFAATVTIGGDDVSSRLYGSLRIDKTVNASHLLTFTMIPTAGPLDPMTWLNKIVLASVTTTDTDGATLASTRRYRGVVSNAEYSPDDRSMRVTCTTDLQGKMERSSRADIDAVVPGDWSSLVFSHGTDGWRYAQNKLSTSPSDIWQDENGAFQSADWAAKTTPDHTFTDSKRFNNTLTITRATRRDLLNKVTATVDYRYSRKRQREVQVRTAPARGAFAHQIYFLLGVRLFTEKMFQDAIDGSGWELVSSVSFEKPKTGVYWVPSSFGGFEPIVAIFADNLVFGAQFTMARRWIQDVTERHTFTVTSPQSITYSGEIATTETFGFDGSQDLQEYESTPFTTRETGMVLDDSGDWILDVDTDTETGRTAFNTGQMSVKNLLKTKLLNAHRQNRVSFQIPFHHQLTLADTIQVSGDYLTAKGKVHQLIEEVNIDTGAATTTVVIALSRHGGTGVDTPTTIAATTAEALETTEHEPFVYLPWYIGNSVSDSPPLTGDEYGLFTNYWYPPDWNPLAWTPFVEQYPYKVVLQMPEISSSDRAAVETSGADNIVVEIPQDLLVMEA